MLDNFSIKTDYREQLVNITPYVIEIVSKKKIKNGILMVYTPHTTAAITINENSDPSVKSDIISFTNKLIPKTYNFDHLEGNSDAHIKASFFGNSQSFIIDNGEILLGRWQDIFLCEFDGPRNRKVFTKIIEG